MALETHGPGRTLLTARVFAGRFRTLRPDEAAESDTVKSSGARFQRAQIGHVENVPHVPV